MSDGELLYAVVILIFGKDQVVGSGLLLAAMMTIWCVSYIMIC